MPTQNAILVDDSEDEEVRTVASSHRQSYDEPMFCMFCNVDLNKYAPEDRQKHYDEHLSSMDTLPPPIAGSRPRNQPSSAKKSPIKGNSFNSSIHETADRFWYQSLESEPPSNYTPGLIPLLRRVLLNSVDRGATRRAVLCYEKAVHIYHEIWDAGWCCGNFMMLCAALVDQDIQPGYFSLLSHPTPPGVDNLKVWIEEAWKSGFDPEGAKGLKGKLVGHNKWIGTAELYVAFTYRGIPSRLADFNTPDGDVTPLLNWIRCYFDGDTQGQSTSAQERWRGATPVVISTRMPLILQHQGHSRTIVGYEIAKYGGTILLAFDPSTRMTPIRDIALSSFNSRNQRGNNPGDSKHGSTARHFTESPLHSRNKRGGGPSSSPGGRRLGSPKRLRADSVGEDVQVIVIDDSRASPGSSSKSPSKLHKVEQIHSMVERGAGETVRKGRDDGTLDPRKVLRLFRVDQKKLSKKDKYQVLWCPMEDPLTEPDKQARREVTSDHVC